jgi:hypothetical protein
MIYDTVIAVYFLVSAVTIVVTARIAEKLKTEPKSK